MAYVCSVCGKRIKTAQGLFMHKRLAHQMSPKEAKRHPMTQVYVCPFCGMTTRHSSSLYRHLREVEGV